MVFKLNNYHSQLGKQESLSNVYVLGRKTHLLRRDIPSIEMPLSNYAAMTGELQELEPEVLQWQRTGALRAKSQPIFQIGWQNRL